MLFLHALAFLCTFNLLISVVTKDPAPPSEPIMTPEPTLLEQSLDYTVSPYEEEAYGAWEEEPTPETKPDPQVTIEFLTKRLMTTH